MMSVHRRSCFAVLFVTWVCVSCTDQDGVKDAGAEESTGNQPAGEENASQEFYGCYIEDLSHYYASDPCGSPGYLNVECLFFCGNEDAGVIEYFGTERAVEDDGGCAAKETPTPETPPHNTFYFQFCQKYCEGLAHDIIPKTHHPDAKGDLTFDRDYRATKSTACAKSGGKLVGMYNASLACNSMCDYIR